MTWWEVAIGVWFLIASTVAAYCKGRNDEYHKSRSREEAIRMAAYRKGAEVTANRYRRLMNPEEWDRLYEARYNKESS
jgi:hypothetical protein